MDLLQLQGISKHEGNLKLIDNISLKAESGQCIGIKCSEETGLLLFKLILCKVPQSKGTILIDNKSVQNIKNKISSLVAVILKDEGMYERLTVNDYLELFIKLYNFKGSFEEVKSIFGLNDIQNISIKNLSFSQKKRVSFSRAAVSEAKINLIQEPTLNLDKESISIILDGISYLCSKGSVVICTSVAAEEILLLGGQSYTLNEEGLNAIPLDEGTERISDNDINTTYKINKIPAKIDEKIILFNPTEIMYIESMEGISYMNVNGEKYPCSMTLNELENRLKIFGFFRCHRAYLVNLQMVREIITWTRNSFSIVLNDKNKSSIPLSKGKLNELKEILNIS